MSNPKSLKKNLSRLTAVTGILLLVLGLSLWGISVYMIQNREQLLNNPDITSEKMWQVVGSLSWWRKAYGALFFPLSIVLVALGAFVLLSRQLWLKMRKKYTLKTSLGDDFDFKKNLSMTNAIDETVLNATVVKNPETVEHLLNFVQQESNFSEETLLNRILILQNEGKIKLNRTSPSATSWYWIVLLSACVTVFLVLQIPENYYLTIYARQFLGSFFVLMMPGYSLVKLLYPRKTIANIERIGLSIAMSMALTCLVAFILNFTPWKITLLSLVVSLSLVTIIFTNIAVLRERYT